MIHIQRDFQLQRFNTFNIPAKAEYFASFKTSDELTQILNFVNEKGLKFFVLGAGANMLFTKDFDGMVIHPAGDMVSIDNEVVTAESGTVWDSLVETSVRAGLGGLENLSFIPGSVGAAPVQNVGAYGAEAGDSILWVEYMDVTDRQIKRINKGECMFGYRDSVFKHSLAGRAIILKVAFGLERESSSYRYKLEYGSLSSSVLNPSLENVRKVVIETRRGKLPDPAVIGSAGSFFRNPVVSEQKLGELKTKYPEIVSFALPSGEFKLSAGWLVERAGWKGRSLGHAAVYDKQALVLVNPGGATGKEVLALSDRICEDVDKLFGVRLHPEVIIL